MEALGPSEAINCISNKLMASFLQMWRPTRSWHLMTPSRKSTGMTSLPFPRQSPPRLLGELICHPLPTQSSLFSSSSPPLSPTSSKGDCLCNGLHHLLFNESQVGSYRMNSTLISSFLTFTPRTQPLFSSLMHICIPFICHPTHSFVFSFVSIFNIFCNSTILLVLSRGYLIGPLCTYCFWSTSTVQKLTWPYLLQLHKDVRLKLTLLNIRINHDGCIKNTVV